MTRMMALLIALAAAAPASAQWLKQPTPGLPRTADGKPNLSAAAPRNVDGTPDISGIWMFHGLGYTFNVFGDQDPGSLPWTEALYRERQANYAKDSPDTKCLPSGPRAGLFGMSLTKILQTPHQLAILYEGDPTRQIFLDGRPMPTDPNPTWMGYSVGRWEGDTLVVRTTGYNDRTWLDVSGHPHTEALQVTERFHRTDVGHMDLQITFEDPNAYRRPWTISVKATLVPDTELLEFVCNENEKDAHHLVGHVDDERKDEVEVPEHVLARYVGVYRLMPLGDIHVSVEHGQLGIQLPGGGGDTHRAFARSETRFFLPALGSTLEFGKDAHGVVTHMVVTIVEGDQKAMRIAD